MSKCCKKTERSEEEKKLLISRINRISGQVNGIKNMIEEDDYCNDILIQIVAAEKSLKSLANLMFENHTHRCISNDIEKGNVEVVDELTSLFKSLMIRRDKMEDKKKKCNCGPNCTCGCQDGKECTCGDK